jgi:hypothetical protein
MFIIQDVAFATRQGRRVCARWRSAAIKRNPLYPDVPTIAELVTLASRPCRSGLFHAQRHAPPAGHRQTSFRKPRCRPIFVSLFHRAAHGVGGFCSAAPRFEGLYAILVKKANSDG